MNFKKYMEQIVMLQLDLVLEGYEKGQVKIEYLDEMVELLIDTMTLFKVSKSDKDQWTERIETYSENEKLRIKYEGELKFE